MKMEMTVTEYREQKKEQAKQLTKHTKGDLVDKLLFAYDTIRRLETKLQNTSSNSDYAKCSHVIGLICGTLGIEVSKCNELNLHDIYHKLIEMKQATRELFEHFA
jgi:hypothetical protein